eukprot:TRINITY_DN20351_c0_g1_i1.p1 TRINITY_DN20351_c0_g1~~TRINITY_DN20351_c0_g1_i1.p1  ORF type:complete len:163 (+),score=29.00 TRINITY_DN20351_c0_g1_i1:144-632(+)
MEPAGESDLETLIRTMRPTLMPEVFVFLNLHNNDELPSEIFQKSVFTFKEKEGNTFVLPRPIVERLGYQYEYPCRMISLEVHSSLSAVGFLAVILRHLADQGVSCNVASGFFHDHLFVPDGEEDRVMESLKILSESLGESSDEDFVVGEEEEESDTQEESEN